MKEKSTIKILTVSSILTFLVLVITFIHISTILDRVSANKDSIEQVHSSMLSFQNHVLKLKGSNPPSIRVGRSDKVDIITTSSNIIVQLEAKKLFPDDNDIPDKSSMEVKKPNVKK